MNPHQKKNRIGWSKTIEALNASSLFPAQEKQKGRLRERKKANIENAKVLGTEFEIFRGVYQTSTDTELMVEAVAIGPRNTFLEIGCGCGAVSLLLAQRAKSGLGVDVNPKAVENAIWNQARLGITNLGFMNSDVFQNITGKFDALICNPPYNMHAAKDSVERMFWDPDNAMKQNFFAGARKFLKRNGKIYFGWADFADLDGLLPLRLAEQNGFRYVRHFVRASKNGVQRFFVIVFR